MDTQRLLQGVTPADEISLESILANTAATRRALGEKSAAPEADPGRRRRGRVSPGRAPPREETAERSRRSKILRFPIQPREGGGCPREGLKQEIPDLSQMQIWMVFSRTVFGRKPDRKTPGRPLSAEILPLTRKRRSKQPHPDHGRCGCQHRGCSEGGAGAPSGKVPQTAGEKRGSMPPANQAGSPPSGIRCRMTRNRPQRSCPYINGVTMSAARDFAVPAGADCAVAALAVELGRHAFPSSVKASATRYLCAGTSGFDLPAGWPVFRAPWKACGKDLYDFARRPGTGDAAG